MAEQRFEQNQFFLMNKDIPILKFISEKDALGDFEFDVIESYSDVLPIGFTDIGTWLQNRQAPKHREHIAALLKSCGCDDLDGYIRFTYALTLNDSFWIRPANKPLKWVDVSLFCNEFDETIARIAFEGGLYGEQFSTTSPEFGTDGTFAKCWIREDDKIYLIKQGSSGARNAGLEPYSEMYTSQLALHICTDAIPYEVVRYRGKVASKCLLFTNEQEGFAPISRVLPGRPTAGKLLEYFSGIGSDDAFRRMLVLDALVLNTDRHMGNFGILFDTDTMVPIRMAPVFDNNQALLPYAENENFMDLQRYLASRPTRIGNDFNEIAHALLTPAIRADLRNLSDFKFDRSTRYSLPEERLKVLEKVVNMQIDNVLKDVRLYVTEDAKQAINNKNVNRKQRL